MFCQNCGSNIPDGSNFCSVCGAKQEKVAPETPIDDYSEDNKKVVENRTQPISFDWSNVKEESHKKVIPEVHSPWGTTSFDSKDLFESEDFKLDEEPSTEPSRTMSFIDLLKQERDAKAQAAAEEASQFTEKEEEPLDYSAFEEVKSYYVPPLYKIEEEPEEPAIDPFESAKHASSEPVQEETFEPTLVEQDFAESRATEDFEFDEPIPDFDDATFQGENISFDTVDLDTASFLNEAEAGKTTKDLDNELEEILSAGTGKHAAPEDIDLFEEPVINEEPKLENKTVDDRTLADLYLSFDADTTVAPEPVPEAKLEFAESEEKEPEESSLESLLENEKKEPSLADTMQFSYEEETPDEESEIEDLKRRLSNLMSAPSEKVEEPSVPVFEIKEEELEEKEEADEPLVLEIKDEEKEEIEDKIEDKIEELVEEPVEDIVVEETEEDEDEAPLVFEITDDDEDDDDTEEETILEIQLGDDDDDEEEEEPEQVESKPETDAISVEELEKDLFGSVAPEDIEAEATKKIDKFYTLYKKNEEFQRLLDEEYKKLKTEDAVPHVDDLLNEKSEPVLPEIEEETVAFNFDKQEEAKETVADKADDKAEKAADKAAEKAAKKEAKKAAKAEQAGSKLTIVAVVIAALLLIILGIILILYIAPYSGLAMKIDTFLETITSLFSATDIVKTSLLM